MSQDTSPLYLPADLEKRLQDAERRYREIVEHSIQGFYQATPDGGVLMANAALATMLGYDTPQQLVDEGEGVWDRLHVDPQRREEYLKEVHTRGFVHGFEARLRRRDQRVIWIAENARAVFNDDGTCRYRESFVEDITARKEAEQLKVDFVSFVTHQLRTPLAGIRWMLESIEHVERLDAETRSAITDAHTSSLRLIRLVNDLLEITRLEGGNTDNPVPIDLAALTKQAISDLSPHSVPKQQTISVTAGDVPQVLLDPRLGRQMVMNFLSNAIKYTPQGGTIEVDIACQDGAVRWSVRDTGIGIPLSSQTRLFEKFYRAENAESVDTEGTGLGLYLVRLIAERSGGCVSCTSVVGEGSTFTLTLPAAPCAATAA